MSKLPNQIKDMKIAITGTIGSGKSKVCEYISKKGYSVFSCDEYNKFLLEKGNEGYLLIKKNFPECIKDDLIDKKTLAQIVFNDEDKRLLLEGLLHPLIIKKMMEETSGKDVFFAEVPLLFESGLESSFDSSWLIVCDENIALERLVIRGLSKQEAIERINTQMPVEDKKNKATEIIYNNKDLIDLYNNIDILLEKYVG